MKLLPSFANRLLITVLALAPLSVVSCGDISMQQGQNASELSSDNLSSRKAKFRKVHRAISYSRTERARFLADAVRGIGDSTAQRLINDYHFLVPVSSWSQFKSYMRTLDSFYRFRSNPTNLYELTVQKYGSDNSKLFSSHDDDQDDDISSGWGCTFDKSRSRNARANCLADAVRGIGKSTATTFINNNEFRYAPRSWTKFKEYMRILENRYDVNDLYHNTVERYGSSNKSKLYR